MKRTLQSSVLCAVVLGCVSGYALAEPMAPVPDVPAIQKISSQPAVKKADVQAVAAKSAGEDKAKVDTKKPKPENAAFGQSLVRDPLTANVTGEIETYRARADDTMLTVAQEHGLGYVELRSANPAVDPWKPGANTYLILPKKHLLPDAPRRGVVINLSEMRMYYYDKSGEVVTFPIGVGREGFSTPLGSTTVTRKTDAPVWRPTDRMRREDPTLKPVVNPGPENPLGTHALYLGWPSYLMHGTNKPWGIGRRVSSGCVRMYNQDAQKLYEIVPVGTTVTTVRQPVKFGWIGDMLYIEAHPDGMLADQVERKGGALDYEVPSDTFTRLNRAAGDKRGQIDWKRLRMALRERRGYPIPILVNAQDEHFFVSEAMERRAGITRIREEIEEQEAKASEARPAKPASASTERQQRRRHARHAGDRLNDAL